MKYVLVSGGVMSGIGKGVVASSIGMLLKAAGLSVTSIKIDAYINFDAGTMSPFEHGEVFVLSDGGEADLDLGNYERFLDVTLSSDNNITTGKIYQRVIDKERKGLYLGKTVQVVPHVVDEIQAWIERVAARPVRDGVVHAADASASASTRVPDVCIIELGGTVGDIELMPFVEALRQFAWRVGRANFVDVHVSLVPLSSGEQKSKPTQTTVAQLRQLGLQPDFIFCRCSEPLAAATKAKIAMFCQLDESHVLGVHDVSNLYAVPLLLEQQALSALLTARLSLPVAAPELSAWRQLSSDAESLARIAVSREVRVAFVGKYVGLQDAYKSLIKALTHAAIVCHVRLELVFVESSLLAGKPDDDDAAAAAAAADAWAKVRLAHAVLVPGGFGVRGVEGKVAAVRYARENRVPFFGICLGLQVAVIEITRTVLGWHSNSEEFDDRSTHYNDAELRISRDVFDGSADDADAAADVPPPSRNVIVFMPEVSKTHMGGTMRLGERRTIIHDPQCLSARLYGAAEVFERHRHRYEVDPTCVAEIESRTDLRFVGRDESGQRMEIAELPESVHPFFVAVQFHPEFLSRPLRPSPLFVGFVKAAAARMEAEHK